MSDVFDEHYRLLQSDSDARRRLIENPKAELARFFSAPLPDGSYEIEIVEQRDDTITVLLPTAPADPQDVESRLHDVAGHVLDLLFTTGVGGYLIPDEQLTWTLRDMRSSWAARSSADAQRGR